MALCRFCMTQEGYRVSLRDSLCCSTQTIRPDLRKRPSNARKRATGFEHGVAALRGNGFAGARQESWESCNCGVWPCHSCH